LGDAANSTITGIVTATSSVEHRCLVEELDDSTLTGEFFDVVWDYTNIDETELTNTKLGIIFYPDDSYLNGCDVTCRLDSPNSSGDNMDNRYANSAGDDWSSGN